MNSVLDKTEQQTSNSRVALCILKPAIPLESYSNTLLSEIFERYGRVMALRIIERNVKLKALVEYETHEQMELSRAKLHKTTVEGFGTFEIYASKKASVSTQSSNYESSEYDWLSHSDRNAVADDVVPNMFTFRPKNAINSLEDLNYQIARIARPKTFSLAEIPHSPGTLFGPETPGGDQASGKVLMLNRLDLSKVNKQMIANLLGCFSNVLKVIINFESMFALVEVQSEEQAKCVIRNLSGHLFFGKPLKIKTSKYSSLSLKKLDPQLNPRLDTLAVDPSQHRFHEDPGAPPVPPSPALLFADLPLSVTPKILFDYVCIVHEPQKIKPMGSNSPNHLHYLVTFENSFFACDVLSVFQFKQFDSEVIKISFTLSQI